MYSTLMSQVVPLNNYPKIYFMELYKAAITNFAYKKQWYVKHKHLRCKQVDSSLSNNQALIS